MNQRKKKIFIISGPSGSGKNVLVKELLKVNKSLGRVLTCTTRKKRKGERVGKDYIYLSESLFRKKIDEGYFLEYEETHGFLYGTPKEELERVCKQGKMPVMVIDVKGGLNLKTKLREYQVVLIFIKSESLRELRRRIYRREASISRGEVRRRMQTAETELALGKKYRYLIANRHGHLAQAVVDLKEIIRIESLAERRDDSFPLAE